MSRTVLVTGAGGNLGRAVVVCQASKGDAIIAVDRGALVADGFGIGSERLLTIGDADLTDATACEAAVRQALDRFGRLDGVVATVGGFAAASAAETDAALWQRMLEMNVITTLNIFRAAIPALQATGAGSFVAVGAGAALKGTSGLAAYAGSKAALLRLVESFADEFKSTGVRVNAVLPGTIDTPQNRAAMPGADISSWVSPVQIGAVIAFLLDPASSGVTGASIPVPGRG